MFHDRIDAGRRLAERLGPLAADDAVVVALPRGGVPVGYEVARRLGAPLDLALVRKLGYPGQPDYAIGAVTGGRKVEYTLTGGLPLDSENARRYLQLEIEAQVAEIERMRETYCRNRPPEKVEGRVVIVVDDGVATGATMRAAIMRLRKERPRRVIAAAPVAAPDLVAAFRSEGAETVFLETPDDFRAVGRFYARFGAVSDEEVVRLLEKNAAERRGVPRP